MSNGDWLKEDLAYLRERVDELHGMVAPLAQADIPRRLGKLEGWRNYIAGALAVLSFGVGVALTILR